MSVIVIADTPGMDAEGYERIFKEMDQRVDELPAGCSAHFAGPADGGWRVVAVWDSAEQVAEFAQTVLGPAMQRAGFTPLRPQVDPVQYALTQPQA
jgi:hypothetical protein